MKLLIYTDRPTRLVMDQTGNKGKREEVMSDEFQLSQQLFEDVKDAIQKHDSRARDDIIAAQYMAALIGLALAQQHMAPPKKRELLDQLGGFAGHVLNEVEQQQMPPPPAQDAFGVWRPGDA